MWLQSLCSVHLSMHNSFFQMFSIYFHIFFLIWRAFTMVCHLLHSHIQFISGVLNRFQWPVQNKHDSTICLNNQIGFVPPHYSLFCPVHPKKGISITFKHHIQEYGLSFCLRHSVLSFRMFSGLLQADRTCLGEAVLTCFLFFVALWSEPAVLVVFPFSFCQDIFSIRKAMTLIYTLCAQSLSQFFCLFLLFSFF